MINTPPQPSAQREPALRRRLASVQEQVTEREGQFGGVPVEQVRGIPQQRGGE